MFDILSKEQISQDFILLKIHAPHIRHAKAGQFVLLQLKEHSERIPVCVFETFDNGFSCLVQVVGRSTLEIKEEGDAFYYIAGPLGKPFPVGNYGKVVIYSRGWGIAPAISVGRALKDLGNYVKMVCLDESLSHLLKREGFDEVVYQENIVAYKGFDLVVSVGSNMLSKILSQMYDSTPHITMPVVHMLCATGLCITCRVKSGLACTDGPWFEAKEINWEDLLKRESLYKEQEKLALEEYKKVLLRKQLREEVEYGKDAHHHQT